MEKAIRIIQTICEKHPFCAYKINHDLYYPIDDLITLIVPKATRKHPDGSLIRVDMFITMFLRSRLNFVVIPDLKAVLQDLNIYATIIKPDNGFDLKENKGISEFISCLNLAHTLK